MKNNTFVRAVCRVLIAGLIWLPLQAQAELIATTHSAAAAQAQSARAAIAVQLEALGIGADSARERVAALTDAEALDLVGRVQDAPAGAFAWAVLILAAFLIWHFNYQEKATAAQKPPAPQKEPAKK
jgi:hypothetical protein